MRTKSDAKKIGEAIRTERQRCGYTPKKLATLMGLTVETIKDIEAGQFNLNVDALTDFAEALRTTPDRLTAYCDASIGIRTRLEDLDDKKLLTCYLNGWVLETVDYRKSGNIQLTFREKEKC